MPEPLLRVFVLLSQQPRRNEEGRGGVGREGGEAKGTHALQRSHPEMGFHWYTCFCLQLRFPVTNPTTLNPTSSDTYYETCSHISPET